MDREAVEVDMKKFSVRKSFYEVIYNFQTHPWLSPSHFFSAMFLFIGSFLIYRLARRPIEWYYDWDDPLEVVSNATSKEHTRERLKYKNRVKGWQEEA